MAGSAGPAPRAAGSFGGGSGSARARGARWADLDDTPAAGSAAADGAAAQVSVQQPNTACGGASGAPFEADSARSTSAASEAGAEEVRERWADIGSDGEQEPAGEAAAAPPPPARRRPPRAKEASGSSSSGAAWQPLARQGAQPAAGGSAKGWAARGGRDRRRGAPCGWGQPARRGPWKAAGCSDDKKQCQFTIGIQEEPTFRVVRRLLGPHGQHVKRIAELTGARLRLRGRGSGFLEGPEQQDVYAEYRKAFPNESRQLCIDLHEGPRDGSY